MLEVHSFTVFNFVGKLIFANLSVIEREAEVA